MKSTRDDARRAAAQRIVEQTPLRDTTSREICKLCFHANSVGYHVPDDVWFSVVPDHVQHSVVCLSCFTRLGDEKGVPWDDDISFYPVSLATHLGIDRTIYSQAAALVALLSRFEAASSDDRARLADRARNVFAAAHERPPHPARDDNALMAIALALLDLDAQSLTTVKREVIS